MTKVFGATLAAAVLAIALALIGCRGCGGTQTGDAGPGAVLPPTLDGGARERTGDIEVRDVFIDRDSFGNAIVEFELRNNGLAVVTNLELRLKAPTADGGTLFESIHRPVDSRSYHQETKMPLAPGGLRRSAIPLEKVPPGGRKSLLFEILRVEVASTDAGG